MFEGQEHVGCEVFVGRLSTLVSQGLTCRVPLKTGACKRHREQDFPHSMGVHRLDEESDAHNVCTTKVSTLLSGPDFVHTLQVLHLKSRCSNTSVGLAVTVGIEAGDGRHQRERVNTPSS